MTAQQGRNGEDLIQVSSALTLTDVKSSDAGVYQCVVSNVIATIYSTQAAVTVSGKYHIHDTWSSLLFNAHSSSIV